MDAKTKSIVAHLTIIGWVIALVMNSSEKDELASFYLRQMLGIVLLGVAIGVVGWLPIPGIGIISGILYIGVIVLWVISLIHSLSGEAKLIPVVGEHFQNWFSSL